MSSTDKGVYKLIARNEKGEATSQTVEVTEITEEGDKPRIVSGLKSAVSEFYTVSIVRSTIRIFFAFF